MSTFDESGKKKLRLFGRYLIETTAGILYYSHLKKKVRMTKLFDFGTDSTVKTFIIEIDGHLMYADTVGTFEIEQVGSYKEFYAKHLS